MKQGPLAVITNALMPAVLVEVGFITNPEEERLLTEGTFQENTANGHRGGSAGVLPPVPGRWAPLRARDER